MFLALFSLIAVEYQFCIKIQGPTQTAFKYTDPSGNTNSVPTFNSMSSRTIQYSSTSQFKYSFIFPGCTFDQSGEVTTNSECPVVSGDYLSDICSVKKFPSMQASESYLVIQNTVTYENVQVFVLNGQYYEEIKKGEKIPFSNNEDFSLDVYVKSNLCTTYKKIGTLNSYSDSTLIKVIDNSDIPEECVKNDGDGDDDDTKVTTCTISGNQMNIDKSYFDTKCRDAKKLYVTGLQITIMNGAGKNSKFEIIEVTGNQFSINNNAFENSKSLKTVILSGSQLTVNSNAFKDCTSLSSVTISGNQGTVKDYAFCNCPLIKNNVVMTGLQTTLSQKAYDCNGSSGGDDGSGDDDEESSSEVEVLEPIKYVLPVRKNGKLHPIDINLVDKEGGPEVNSLLLNALPITIHSDDFDVNDLGDFSVNLNYDKSKFALEEIPDVLKGRVNEIDTNPEKVKGKGKGKGMNIALIAGVAAAAVVVIVIVVVVVVVVVKKMNTKAESSGQAAEDV